VLDDALAPLLLLLLLLKLCCSLVCAASVSSSKPKGLDGDINEDDTTGAAADADGNAEFESPFEKKSSVSATTPDDPEAAIDVVAATTGDVVKKSELSAAVEVVSKNASLSAAVVDVDEVVVAVEGRTECW